MEDNQTSASPKKSMNTMMIVGAVVVVIVLAGGFLLFGSRGANAPTTSTPQSVPSEESVSSTAPSEVLESVSIQTQNFAFSPSTIKIKAGGTISFTNKDSAKHSITSDDGKSFDSGLIAKDQTKTVKAPTEPGTYTFHCSLHPSMKGTLIVE